MQPFDDDMLRRFFGGEIPPGVEINPQQQPRERTGEGSGVVMRDDGYIVTNNHVVDGATDITVRLADESEYKGKVIGTDPDTDVAVVKIEASGLAAAHFGDSDTVDVGQWVVAIGSPFGLRHTVTAGIVSAKGRANMGLATFEDFIQTDAAINPGNSGGPLVSLEGEVIGLNTAISTQTGAYNGIGFAIPSNMVRTVFESIVASGNVKRGALGVGIGPLDKDAADYFGYSSTNGVVITEVYPNSGADKAGLKVGDIITSIDDKPTTDNHVLLNTIAKDQPGQTIKVGIFRDGKSKTVDVTLGDRSVQFANLSRGGNRGNGHEEGSADANPDSGLGLTVEELTPEIAQELNASTKQGVVVSAVEAGSAAAEKGLRRGDIIDMVGKQRITSVDDYNAAVRKAAASGKGVALRAVRGETATLIVLKAKPESKDKDD
jgi:serine protease Do